MQNGVQHVDQRASSRTKELLRAFQNSIVQLPKRLGAAVYRDDEPDCALQSIVLNQFILKLEKK